MENYLSNEKTIFAFNIWDINSAKAVIDVAADVNKNIILQTSSSIFQSMPKRQMRDFVSSYSVDKKIKVWLHLDHCKKEELIKEAIKFGWDSVMIDVSDKELSENIRITNEITAYAHDQKVLVEAEVGRVKGVEDDVDGRDGAVASMQDITRFLEETNIDMIAVAFGNAHGIYHGTPKLCYDLVEYTVGQTDIPFVVHGGSGLRDEILKKLMKIHNVKKINISTDVKLAYRKGIMQAYYDGKMEEDGFQAVIVEQYIHNAIKEMVESKLALLK
ncbi:MAG: class II fructose-bisphosphate aldolase [Lachnospiraceae bacterium]|nr:class II fructose-bisphosphate aldolase [Lachnospiraceae bacterium]